MQFTTIILSSLLAFSSVISAAPSPIPTSTPPPFGKSYVTGYPVCHVVGYQIQPSNCVVTNYALPGADLTWAQCQAACKAASGCLSYSWGWKSGGCVFLSGELQNCQVYAEGISKFSFYDLACTSE